MSEAHYEALVSDNNELNKALTKTKTLFEQEVAEKQNLVTIIEDYKTHFDRLTMENAQIQKKLTEEISAKRLTKEHHDVETDRLKVEVGRRQKEIEEVLMTAAEPMQVETLRMKARKEVDVAHRAELDERQSQVEDLQNQLEKAKREREAANIDLDSVKVEIEKERTLSKAKYREELDEVLKENETLRGEIERSRDREKLHEVRRDHEESKRMQEELSKQVMEL